MSSDSDTDSSGSDIEQVMAWSKKSKVAPGGGAYHVDVTSPDAQQPKGATSPTRKTGPLTNHSGCRYHARECMDNPNSSWPAFIFSNFMIVLILASVLTLCLSTMDEEWTDAYDFHALEMAFNLVFTVELVCRLVLMESCAKAFSDPYMYFDLISIVPFWIEFALPGAGDAVLDTLKAFKMLRLLKLSRQYEGSIILFQAIERSKAALGVPFFFLGVAVIIFAAFVYYLEKANSTLEAGPAFTSIPHAIWFVTVTMTTVGYGDVVPNTAAAKVISIMVMVFGVLFLSMPLAIVGQNFVTIWNDRERVIFIQRLRQSLLDNDVSKARVISLFNQLDADGSGLLSFKEFRMALAKLNIRMSTGQLMKLWWAVDKDQSGEVSHDEFMSVCFDGQEQEKDDSDPDEADLHAVVDTGDEMLTKDTRMLLTQMGAMRTQLLDTMAGLSKDINQINRRLDQMGGKPTAMSTTKSVTKKQVIYNNR